MLKKNERDSFMTSFRYRGVAKSQRAKTFSLPKCMTMVTLTRILWARICVLWLQTTWKDYLSGFSQVFVPFLAWTRSNTYDTPDRGGASSRFNVHLPVKDRTRSQASKASWNQDVCGHCCLQQRVYCKQTEAKEEHNL